MNPKGKKANPKIKYANVQFKSDNDIKKKYGLTQKQLAQYKRDEPIRYFYNNTTKEIIKYNIRDNDVSKKLINTIDRDDEYIDVPAGADDNIIDIRLTQKQKLNQAIKHDPNLTYTKGERIFRKWGIIRTTKERNKKIILGNQDIKNNLNDTIEVLKNIDEETPENTYSLTLQVKFILRYENDILIRYKLYKYVGKNHKFYFERFLIPKIIKYLQAFSFIDSKKYEHLIFKDIYVRNKFNHRSGKFKDINGEHNITYKILSSIDEKIEFTLKEDGRMKEIEYYNIHNLVDNIEELDYYENCIRDYLKEIYNGRISEKTINKLGDKNGVTPNELIDFCKRYTIKMILYDINGKAIKWYYPTEKSTKKSIVGIYYNDHFYPCKNHYVNKCNGLQCTKILTQEDLSKSFNELLKNKIIPADINISKDEEKLNIISYTHDNVSFVCNNDYEICRSLLISFGLLDKLTPYTTLSNISKIFESLFDHDNVKSFFPVRHVKRAFNYFNNSIDIDKWYKNFMSIDKNKCYMYCLYALPYLIRCDYRTAKIRQGYEIDEITPYYLYVCKPEKSTLLMPLTDIYAGYHIIYCKEKNINFEILQEIECTYEVNYYHKMIEDIMTVFKDKEEMKYIKDMFNRMIGNKEKNIQICENWKVSRIANRRERFQDKEGDYYKYNQDLYFRLDLEKKIKNIYNERPIRYQIIDFSNVLLYQKINEMGIEDNDIVCIKTDEITFIMRDHIMFNKNDFDSTDWKGWKIPELKEKEKFKFNDDNDEIDDNEDVSFFNYEIDDYNHNHNVLSNCYAGSGKSHNITNELIPSLKDNFIVLTPSHNAQKTYKKDNINCNVIQTYEYNGQIPKEKNIIIDEIGLCSRYSNDVIYKCFLMDKNIYSYGDFNQLLPPSTTDTKHYNSDQYLKMIYKNFKQMNTNWRNNFSKEYYDSLINEKIDLIQEIKKHSLKDFKNAEIILCKTNKECDKYNELVLQDKKLKFGDIGCNIICITNKLRNHKIFNSFTFQIIDRKKNIITLDNDIEITIDELKNNFKAGYAITFYKAQGQQYKSFYVPETSMINMTGRIAYTIISRLDERHILKKPEKKEKDKTKLKLSLNLF